MYSTALRISDVAMLRRDRIQNGEIFLHTKKTGEKVYLPVDPELQKALDAVPPPRRAGANPACYFWNETSAQNTIVGTMERMLRAVFKRAKVKAHAHKFRHYAGFRTIPGELKFELIGSTLAKIFPA